MIDPNVATQTGNRITGWKAVAAAGALAVVSTSVLGPSVEAGISDWHDRHVLSQKQDHLMEQPGLINEFKDGVPPAPLQGEQLGTVTLGTGEVASQVADDISALQPVALQGEIQEQTFDGAAGATAVVNLEDIDMAQNHLSEPNPTTGLPEIIPNQQ